MQTGFENEDNELVANVASGEGVRRSTSGGVVQHQASPGNGNRRVSAVRPPPRRSSSSSLGTIQLLRKQSGWVG